MEQEACGRWSLQAMTWVWEEGQGCRQGVEEVTLLEHIWDTLEGETADAA